MTEEQLTEAQKLKDQIQELQEDVSAMTHGRMEIAREPLIVFAHLRPDQWDVVRQMALSNADQKLNEARNKFNEL